MVSMRSKFVNTNVLIIIYNVDVFKILSIIYCVLKIKGITMTFLYEKMIEQWTCDVEQYCIAHNIPNMELKNLRQDDVYNYELYTAYKNVLFAIDVYRKTPSSPLYAKGCVGTHDESCEIRLTRLPWLMLTMCGQ